MFEVLTADGVVLSLPMFLTERGQVGLDPHTLNIVDCTAEELELLFEFYSYPIGRYKTIRDTVDALDSILAAYSIELRNLSGYILRIFPEGSVSQELLDKALKRRPDYPFWREVQEAAGVI